MQLCSNYPNVKVRLTIAGLRRKVNSEVSDIKKLLIPSDCPLELFITQFLDANTLIKDYKVRNIKVESISGFKFKYIIIC